MNLVFFDKHPEVYAAYKHVLEEVPDTEFYQGDFRSMPGYFDALVSPANSFGFMDGGIDLAYTQHFGKGIQQKFQDYIKCLPNKELFVGGAVATMTEYDGKFGMIICAPTMRTPQRIGGTINIFLAVRAALRVAKNMNMKRVAFPGMGTGVGGVHALTCAKQALAAIRWIEDPPKYTTLEEYCKYEKMIREL